MNVFGKSFFIALLMAALVGSTASAINKKDETSTPDSTVEDLSKIKETLMFNWPAKDKWIPGLHHAGDGTDMQFYFPEGQSTENWQEMVSVETVYGSTKVNVPGMARMTYLGTKKGSPNATWEILKKGPNKDGRPHIIYEIVCPDFTTKEPPQVQLWEIIIGKTALFTLQYSYHGGSIPAERKEQILEMLYSAYIKVEKKED